MSAPTHVSRQRGRISLKVDLAPGQTLASFVSALAARNGLRSITRFCKAFGLDPFALRQGRADAIARLSELSDVSAERLLAAGTWRTSSGFQHMGEKLERAELRTAARVCPQCLVEDQAAQPHLRSHVAARGRGIWMHAWVRTCCRHHLCLVDLPEVVGAKVFHHDLAAQLRALAKSGGALPSTEQSPTSIEVYISDRLSGKGGECPTLDALSLTNALFFAQYLGSPHRDARKLPPPADVDERLGWASAGLAIAASGLPAIDLRLREIVEIVNPLAACEIGLRRVFGQLYDRLAQNADDQTLPHRQLLVRIGLDKNLLAFEQTVSMGLPLPPRDKQTIESARRVFGISDRELRAALVELKVLPSDEAIQRGNATLIDVSPVAPILARLKNSLDLGKAARFLGLHPQQLIRLCYDGNVIRPFFTRPSPHLKPLRYFEQADLAGLMAKLTANCSKVREPGDLVDIWKAALQTRRRPTELIVAIHSGRIATFRTVQVSTIKDILVNMNDVWQAFLDASDDDLVSVEDCGRILGISNTATQKILHAGLLRSEVVIDSVTKRQQVFARQPDVAEFDRQYVSLNVIRHKHRSSGTGMAQALFEARIRPAFWPHLSGVSIYRRADVERVSHRLEQILTERAAKKSSINHGRRSAR